MEQLHHKDRQNSLFKALLLLVLLMPLISCEWDEFCQKNELYKLELCKEKEKYYDVGIAFNAMLRQPSQFCSYLGANQEMFTEKFKGCGLQHVERLGNDVDSIQNYCDSIFLDGDSRRWCDNKYGANDLSNKIFWLAAMLEVTNQINYCMLTNCDCALLGSYIQEIVNVWDIDPPFNKTWVVLIDESLEHHKNEYMCEYSK